MIDTFRFQHSLTGSEVLMLHKLVHYELWDHLQLGQHSDALGKTGSRGSVALQSMGRDWISTIH